VILTKERKGMNLYKRRKVERKQQTASVIGGKYRKEA
jgi:hypothetical protein